MNSSISRRRIAAVAALVTFAAGIGAATDVDARPASHRAAVAPKTVEVQMIGDATGYKFSPAKITIARGDKVKFTLVSGPPHNIVFWEDSIPKGASAKLAKAMPKTVGPLTGPFLLNAKETYEISFAGLPAGIYKYYCAPHLALGMHAVIEVK
ncbi:MAG TPA: plastocyanin/azurin family copper-binding protein [Gemmatimonadaceae bacterium]